MTTLATRDALNVALREWFPMGSARVADALLASGAVIDVATLADDEAPVRVVAQTIYDTASDPTGIKAWAILRALAAALTERSRL